MLRPWRGDAYWLGLHGLLSLLSHMTQDHQTTLQHQSLVNKMPYRLDGGDYSFFPGRSRFVSSGQKTHDHQERKNTDILEGGRPILSSCQSQESHGIRSHRTHIHTHKYHTTHISHMHTNIHTNTHRERHRELHTYTKTQRDIVNKGVQI